MFTKNKDYLIYFRTATFKSNFLCNVKVKERLVMKYSEELKLAFICMKTIMSKVVGC